jgi:PAS domain-containing protein
MKEEETILDDYAFLVSETDEKGIIRFANRDFCNIAEYNLEELIGKPHNIVRHKDMPKAAFKDLWETVAKGNIWTGYVKMQQKVVDITGFLQQFTLFHLVMEQRDTYLVEEKHQKMRLKKYQNYMKFG